MIIISAVGFTGRERGAHQRMAQEQNWLTGCTLKIFPQAAVGRQRRQGQCSTQPGAYLRSRAAAVSPTKGVRNFTGRRPQLDRLTMRPSIFLSARSLAKTSHSPCRAGYPRPSSSLTARITRLPNPPDDLAQHGREHRARQVKPSRPSSFFLLLSLRPSGEPTVFPLLPRLWMFGRHRPARTCAGDTWERWREGSRPSLRKLQADSSWLTETMASRSTRPAS